MRIFNAIKMLVSSPCAFIDTIIEMYGHWIPDKLYLKLRYRCKMGYWPDLKNPKTFNEKLQWLKLYNRKPEYTKMVDKYAVKEFVASKIGDEYIIPTLGVWDRPEEIDWDSLPNQFVLKTTHGGGGGGVVICKDKSTFDKESAKRVLERSLRSDIYLNYREWPYKNVPKRIIAEKFMSESTKGGDLPDYKFYCFDGEPVYCQVIRDRRSVETIDFYDMNWQHQEFVGLNPVARPEHLDDMKRICRKLSEGIPFARIDLYVVNAKEYFGEITFYPASGIGVFTPSEWAAKLGDMIKLPEQYQGGKIRVEGDDILIDRETPCTEGLKDYKFFCFDGKVKCFKVDFDRFTNHRANYYDRECSLLPFGEVIFPPDYNKTIDLPSNIEQMISLAEKLSRNIPFVRVDFYNSSGKIYFGEITFFPAGGVGRFDPEGWDEKLGEYLIIPVTNKNNKYV